MDAPFSPTLSSSTGVHFLRQRPIPKITARIPSVLPPAPSLGTLLPTHRSAPGPPCTGASLARGASCTNRKPRPPSSLAAAIGGGGAAAPTRSSVESATNPRAPPILRFPVVNRPTSLPAAAADTAAFLSIWRRQGPSPLLMGHARIQRRQVIRFFCIITSFKVLDETLQVIMFQV
jgi:hypothetical protein